MTDVRGLRAPRVRGAVPVLLAALALALVGGSAPAANAAPRGAVGGVSSPASGTLMLNVRATDDGAGLASARASVDGVTVASSDLGVPGCGDLAPTGCPSTVTDLQLPVPTLAFSDGTHQLQVSVTDGAGTTAVLLDQPFDINNRPPDRQSTAVLTLGTAGTGTAEATALPSGAGAPGGGVAGAGSAARPPACAAPRLSIFLKDKPLRVVKGVPVLRANGRYRFSGTLTCAVGARRVHAHSGLMVSLLNQIGRKTYLKKGVATRSDGTLKFVLAYPSSRLLEFRYASGDGRTTRVRIRITVARAAKKPAKKPTATKKKAS
ncbi:MAG TPA: hypothetical protein VI318_04675 [Baekduia sp.]